MARKPKASTLFIALGGVVGALSSYFVGYTKTMLGIAVYLAVFYFVLHQIRKR